MCLDRGFWPRLPFTRTKMGTERMVEIARKYGSNRMFIDPARMGCVGSAGRAENGAP